MVIGNRLYTAYFVLTESVQEVADVEKGVDDQEEDSSMPDENEVVSANDGCEGQVNVRCCACLGQKPLSRLRAASRTSQKKRRTCYAMQIFGYICGFLAVLAAPGCACM